MITLLLFTIVCIIGVLLVIPMEHVYMMSPMCTTVALGASFLLNFVISMVFWGEFEFPMQITTFVMDFFGKAASFPMIHEAISWLHVPSHFFMNILHYVLSMGYAFVSWFMDATTSVMSSAAPMMDAAKKAIIDPVAHGAGVAKSGAVEVLNQTRELSQENKELLFKASVGGGLVVFGGAAKVAAASKMGFGGRSTILTGGALLAYETYREIDKYGNKMLSEPVVSAVPRTTEAQTGSIISQANAFKPKDTNISASSLMDWMDFITSVVSDSFYGMVDIFVDIITFFSTFLFTTVSYFTAFSTMLSGSYFGSPQGVSLLMSLPDWIHNDFNLRMTSFVTDSNKALFTKMFNDYNNVVYVVATVFVFFLATFVMYYAYKIILSIYNSKYVLYVKEFISLTSAKHFSPYVHNYGSKFFTFVGACMYKSASVMTKTLPHFSLYVLLVLMMSVGMLVYSGVTPSVGIGILADKLYKYAVLSGVSYPMGDFSIIHSTSINSKGLALLLMVVAIYKVSTQFSYYGVTPVEKLIGYSFFCVLIVSVQMYVLFMIMAIKRSALFAGMFAAYYKMTCIMIVSSIVLGVLMIIFFIKLSHKEAMGYFWNMTTDPKFVSTAYFNSFATFATLLLAQGVIFLATNFIPGDLGSLMDIIVAQGIYQLQQLPQYIVIPITLVFSNSAV